MKLLIIAMMFMSMVACSKEEAKASPIPTPAVTTTPIPPAVAPAATKKVCRDVVVKGKIKSQCKMVKIHKRHKGTKVPEKAKK